MGRGLTDYFERAQQVGGIEAKIRLARRLGMNSAQAAARVEDATLMRRASEAFEAVSAEFTTEVRTARAEPGGRLEKVPQAGPEQRARRYMRSLAEVMTQRVLLFGRPQETYARLTEIAADALEVSRVSLWFYDEHRRGIRCADLFERAAARHSSGTELLAKDFPTYFLAIEQERTIAAHDAHRDPRTAEFSKPYLTPLEIESMLDVPIWSQSQMLGVLCHEQVGTKRNWTEDDEHFAYTIAGLASLAHERLTEIVHADSRG